MSQYHIQSNCLLMYSVMICDVSAFCKGNEATKMTEYLSMLTLGSFCYLFLLPIFEDKCHPGAMPLVPSGFFPDFNNEK